jgi:exodeoxyribonuclease V alpha subunit
MFHNTPPCVLKVQVERITYYNEEDHYTIAKVKIDGKNSLVTVVGTLYSIVPGETLKIEGEWNVHPRYGEQFRITSYETLLPATAKGIERYLGSGMIKGIGPQMAKRLVARFGEATLDVIDTDISRLDEVPGIGEKRIGMIKGAWSEQKEVRNVMVFLQGNGVSPAYAAKIYRFYGNDAVRIVRDNPYRLAVDIFGIGFLTADRIAGNLGIEKEAPFRIETGILYVLAQLAEEGHFFFPYDALVEKASGVLEVSASKIPPALANLTTEKKIIIEDGTFGEGLTGDHGARPVYIASLYDAEKGIAQALGRLASHPKQMAIIDIDEVLQARREREQIIFSERQLDAVRAYLEQKILVITGGPGTGKTTIINGIITIASKTGQKVLCAAPTGRAAKRMTEATGVESRTIHRLLEYNPRELSSGTGFKRNESNLVAADLIIIDEASMVDAPLMDRLLRAIPAPATLILVGDTDQLPSVGPGNVLKDIIDSGCVHTVRLNDIFRQSQQSMIIVNAHRINRGQMPVTETGRDFVFIEEDDPERVLEHIIDLSAHSIPSRFGFRPLDDIQILTPMHRGVVGVTNINIRLQEMLNPSRDAISRGGRTFKTADKVIQTRNNYEKDVYNGDIGRIVRIDREMQEARVDFDGRIIPYDFNELDELILAYAISVHKSQGSEYPAVIIPVLTQHYLLLQRNLIYTAITRGKKLVYMIGTKKALSIAIRNDKTRKRYSLLAERLREAVKDVKRKT